MKKGGIMREIISHACAR